MPTILIAALIIVGFYAICAVATIILVSIGPPSPKKLDFQSRFDNGIAKSLQAAPYIFFVSAAITALSCLWISPHLQFLAVAAFSAVGVFITKCYHWRIRSSTTWFVTALVGLIPYLIARRLFHLPRPALLPVMQYACVTIAVIEGLTWLFRARLASLRQTP